MCAMVGQFTQRKQEEKQIEEEQAAKAQNSKIPACYDDDDDYNFAITPDEPVDSLSIGDENLNTISATESNKFIKSSVKNLVPNPNILEKIFLNPLFDEEIISMKIDPHHFNAEYDLIESLLNHDSSINSSSLKIDFLLDEFVGELTLLKTISPGIDKTDCHPKNEIRLTKRLLYDNSSPHPPEEFFLKILMLKLNLSLHLLSSLRIDILILEELLDNYSLSLPEIESYHFDIPSFFCLPTKPPDDQPIPPAPVVPARQHVAPEILAAHTPWIKESKEIVDLMLMTMEPEIQQNLETLHAHEMLRELKTLFAQQEKQRLCEIFILASRKKGSHLGKTINELHAMLKLYEQTLPKDNAPFLHAIRAGKVQKVNKHKKWKTQMAARGKNRRKGKNKQAYAPNPKIPPPPKKEDPAKDSIYYKYGEIGHSKRNCPQYLAKLLKKKKNAASGAGGSDVFINRFVNNTIQVSRNNMVYFSAIPRDGILEIDLSNSYTNESYIYAVSNKKANLDLDSALLWNCRLGHISKKCIEKLQHDGLLDSTDLRAFEKYVSCMSGKMARKPYTHQVEMAKDILGLIHTDVCGPFKIMSRQGASYFVTFTDDFSHFGYVYLLKHKHEVFETFKVFQKEVENKL
nr:hypothetical protein [Tanacetum cinerariifolium]